jgi:hypothetical protein
METSKRKRGRPRRVGEPDKPCALYIRVRREMYAWIMASGGVDHARKILEEAMEKEKQAR